MLIFLKKLTYIPQVAWKQKATYSFDRLQQLCACWHPKMMNCHYTFIKLTKILLMTHLWEEYFLITIKHKQTKKKYQINYVSIIFSDFLLRLKKIKSLGSHLTFKTTNLQNFVYTTVPDATIIHVKSKSLHLFIPTLTPSSETQVFFNNSIKKSFNLPFDSRTTDRCIIDTQLEYQLDIRYALKLNSPKYLTAAQHTDDKAAAPNKTIDTASFDNLNVRKYFVEIDGIRYLGDCVSVDYKTKKYIHQHRDLKYILWAIY